MSKEFKLSKIELLKMASDQLVKDYLERRTQEHAQWLQAADAAWKNNNTWLQYPAMPAYPSNADIMLKAEELNKFINSESEPETESQKEPAPIPPVTNIENTVTSVSISLSKYIVRRI